jgi:hypothetical protein
VLLHLFVLAGGVLYLLPVKRVDVFQLLAAAEGPGHAMVAREPPIRELHSVDEPLRWIRLRRDRAHACRGERQREEGETRARHAAN